MKTSFSAFLLVWLAALFCTLGHPGYGQTSPADLYLAAGQVIDQKSLIPVPYASLGLLGQPMGTVADEQGRFSLALPPAYLGLLGYAPVKVSVVKSLVQKSHLLVASK